VRTIQDRLLRIGGGCGGCLALAFVEWLLAIAGLVAAALVELLLLERLRLRRVGRSLGPGHVGHDCRAKRVWLRSGFPVHRRHFLRPRSRPGNMRVATFFSKGSREGKSVAYFLRSGVRIGLSGLGESLADSLYRISQHGTGRDYLIILLVCAMNCFS
jgi:hypothetical protein